MSEAAAAEDQEDQPLILSVHIGREQYVAGDGREVHMFLKVAARGPAGAQRAHAPGRSEILIIDCSGSMAHPTFRKIDAARRAVAEVIELLPEGTHFALIEGTETARVVYPRTGEPEPVTAVASSATRAEARRAAGALSAYGGTRISRWLELARQLLNNHPDSAFRHVLLLTDGMDRHREAEELRRVLAACEGEFSCDAIGIGSDYDPEQLLEIVQRLRGTADAVAVPPGDFGDGAPGDGADDGSGSDDSTDIFGERLTALLRGSIGASVGRRLPQLSLRVRPEPYLTVSRCRQFHPTVADLTDGGVRHGDGTLSFPTGAWGEETRWYEVRLRPVPGRLPQPTRDAVRIARVGLDAEGLDAEGLTPPADQSVMVSWTDAAPPLSAPYPLEQHVRRGFELNEAVRSGCAAIARGDPETAEQELGRAVRLAHELNDQPRLRRLERLVLIEDEMHGRVRLRSEPDPGFLGELYLSVGHVVAPPPEAPSGVVFCTVCEQYVPAGPYCTAGGHPLEGAA